MKKPGPPPMHPATAGEAEQAAEQLRYARWLEWGTRAGLAILVIVFLAYAFGLTTPHVSHERLAEVWSLPVGEYLRATGTPGGWGWLSLVHRADVANLLGIAVLVGCSVPCLLALLPLYAARGDRVYIGLCVAEVAVLAMAASGLLTSGH